MHPHWERRHLAASGVANGQWTSGTFLRAPCTRLTRQDAAPPSELSTVFVPTESANLLTVQARSLAGERGRSPLPCLFLECAHRVPQLAERTAHQVRVSAPSGYSRPMGNRASRSESEAERGEDEEIAHSAQGARLPRSRRTMTGNTPAPPSRRQPPPPPQAAFACSRLIPGVYPAYPRTPGCDILLDYHEQDGVSRQQCNDAGRP